MSTKITRELGGFQQAAETLTSLAGRSYSRQGIQQFYERRDVNGFPERKPWTINGHTRELLDMQEVADWYAFVEAALVLRALAGRTYNSSDVYRLWRGRKRNGFPDRKRGENRLAFNLDEIAEWYREEREDDGRQRSEKAEHPRRAAS